MAAIDNLLAALDERNIARQIGLKHDEARMAYTLERNTAADFDEFTRIIADYYNHHFGSCMSSGGRLSSSQAASKAKDILEREYRRRNGDIVAAFNDAHDGTNGGLRVILDRLAESLKTEAVEAHVRDVFDRLVAPNSWEAKVEIIRQFIRLRDSRAGASKAQAMIEKQSGALISRKPIITRVRRSATPIGISTRFLAMIPGRI